MKNDCEKNLIEIVLNTIKTKAKMYTFFESNKITILIVVQLISFFSLLYVVLKLYREVKKLKSRYESAPTRQTPFVRSNESFKSQPLQREPFRSEPFQCELREDDPVLEELPDDVSLDKVIDEELEQLKTIE